MQHRIRRRARCQRYPVVANQYNNVTFTGVSTTQLRVVLQSGAASVGLLEVKALGP